jgi:hypothetical protein
MDYQGPLAIHAAKNFPEWAEDECDDEPFRSMLNEAGYPWQPGTKRNPRRLPLGQIVAVGWLDRVERITQNYAVTATERAFGNYAAGRYAWHFDKIYRLTTPIEARGSLGLWNWQPPESFWAEIQVQHEREHITISIYGSASVLHHIQTVQRIAPWVARGRKNAPTSLIEDALTLVVPASVVSTVLETLQSCSHENEAHDMKLRIQRGELWSELEWSGAESMEIALRQVKYVLTGLELVEQRGGVR